MARTDIYTEQKVYNGQNQHVGTVHKKNGQEYTGSWIVDGKWEHGSGLKAAAPHVSSDYSSLSGVADHRYGANGYVRHEDNYTPPMRQQASKAGGNPYSGSGSTGVGAGAAPGGVNFEPGGITAPPPPTLGTGSSPIIDLAKDRAEEYINDNNGNGGINVNEENNSIVNDIEQNIGNKGDFVVNNNPIDSDQTYATVGNDYSMNLGSINLNNQQYS